MAHDREHMWHQNTYLNVDKVWTTYLEGLDESLSILEKELDETKDMQKQCTGEWCEATEHLLDDLAKFIFSIHEPHTSQAAAQAKKIKELRRRMHALYAKYAALAKQ